MPVAAKKSSFLENSNIQPWDAINAETFIISNLKKRLDQIQNNYNKCQAETVYSDVLQFSFNNIDDQKYYIRRENRTFAAKCQ